MESRTHLLTESAMNDILEEGNVEKYLPTIQTKDFESKWNIAQEMLNRVVDKCNPVARRIEICDRIESVYNDILTIKEKVPISNVKQCLKDRLEKGTYYLNKSSLGSVTESLCREEQDALWKILARFEEKIADIDRMLQNEELGFYSVTSRPKEVSQVGERKVRTFMEAENEIILEVMKKWIAIERKQIQTVVNQMGEVLKNLHFSVKVMDSDKKFLEVFVRHMEAEPAIMFVKSCLVA